MEKIKKVLLSFTLIIAMLVNLVISPGAYASSVETTAATDSTVEQTLIATNAERLNSADVNNAMNGYKLDSAIIVGELTDKREKSTRQFRLDDGTYQAVMYSTAVNYQRDDGTWAEVNNTLVPSTNQAGEAVLQTEGNGYMGVEFARDADAKQMVSITKGTNAISWRISRISTGVSGENGAVALSLSPTVIDDYSARKADLSVNAQKRLADKSTAHIRYAAIIPDVDIDYLVEAERVKENITLAHYIPEFTISFDIAAEGLSVQTLAGGITAFCDAKSEIFYLMPSSIFDNQDNEGLVRTSLEPIDGGYRLTLAPDDNWLQSAIYPVVLDPQIDVDWNASNINDTYISSKYHNGINNDGTNGPWYTYASLRIGYSSTLYTSYGLVKYVALPTLSSSQAVIGAYMISEREDSYVNNYPFTIHNIKKSWSQTAVTWDNFIGSDPSAAFDATIQEAQIIGDTYGPYQSFYVWDITNLMRGWYNGDIPNYGLLMKGVVTDAGYRRFYSANAAYVDDQVQTIIQFVDTTGLERCWSYQSSDVRRAGTASVNLFTGNMVVGHSDIGTDGNRMPVSISHVYNAVNKDDADLGYGKGWQLNYAQSIVGELISGVQYYDYTDGDGTIHYFRNSSGAYIDESGQNRTLEFNKSITDINNNTVTYSYTITDKADNILCFDSYGRLVKIKDCIGNYIAIGYSGITRKITTITDGASRQYSLAYNAGGDLATITAPGSRVISYGYDGSNRLTTITYPDNVSTTYAYFTSGTLNNAIKNLRNFDGYNLELTYNYTTYMYPKAETVDEWGEVAHTTHGGSQTFTYGEKETKVEDHLGNITIYQFNQYGNSVTIQDDQGRAAFSQYYNPTANVPGTTTPYGQNKISLSSKLQEPIMNMAQNHSLETTGNWSSYTVNGGTATLVSTQKYIGNQSVQLYNPAVTAQNVYYQGCTWVKGATYTFSAWIKTVNATGGAGALLTIAYFNSSGTIVYVNSTNNTLTGSNDWTRKSFTFTIPADAANTTGNIYLNFNNTAGYAYFDGIQLEKQPAVNRYNLVQNGDMTFVTSGTPNFWTKSAGCTTADIATTTSDTDRGLLDSNVFKIAGDMAVDKSLYQMINVTGVAGDTFAFGGWAKATAIPLGTKYPINNTSYGRQYGIKIDLKNGTTSAGSVNVPFNDFSNLWQYLSGRVVATGTYTSAVITLLYENECNTAYFDGIQLYKEQFGQCYSYDANGNIVTVKDLSSSSDTMTYDSYNNLTTLQPPDCSGTDKYNIVYSSGNEKHLVDNATSIEGVKSKYDYDTCGNVLWAEIRNNLTTPTAYIRAKADYTSNGNYLLKSYDALGNYVQYNFDTSFGVNKSTIDPLGQAINFTYDDNNSAVKMGKLTDVTATDNVTGLSYANAYSYNNDRLTTITHNGFNYSLGYNTFGLLTTVAAAGQNLVTNTYKTSDRSYLLDYLTYGNGGKLDYTYDSRYRVSAITYDNEATPRFTYTYAANGGLGSVTDNQNSLTTTYDYDLADRLMKITEQYASFCRTFQYGYDSDNSLTQFLESIGTTSFDTDLTYDKDNRITKVNYNNQAAGSENVRYTFDVLGRLNTRTLETGINDYVLTYNYQSSNLSPSGATTSQIASISFDGNSSLSYTYYNNGYIHTVSDGTNTIHYKYDGLGQLLQTDDPTDTRGGANGSVWVNTYDVGGNITAKALYSFDSNNEDLSDNNLVHTYVFTYDTVWKDKLVSYDGNAITSDAIGNTTSYNGWTYTWEAGRQLKQMSNGTTTLQFKYNDVGLRTQKINGATTTTYYWAGSNISHMTSGSDTLHFWYDASGQPAQVTYNGTNYYYKHNLQGDVIGLMDAAGSQVVAYTYDSWGKQLTCTGTLASTLGAANPLRYRGYIYDSEMGLYYLQSRYYDPDWGRFINADSFVSTGQGMNAANMFAYCNNNPVNMTDPTGHFMKMLTDGGGTGGGQSFFIQYYFSLPETVVDELIGEIEEDLSNIPRNNIDERAVINSNWVSHYKDHLVLRHPFEFLTSWSYGRVMFINKNINEYEYISDQINVVKHELGHCIQEERLGTFRYTIRVAIPSVSVHVFGDPYRDDYYSFPWEYGADILGGVNRGGYKDWAMSAYEAYWGR